MDTGIHLTRAAKRIYEEIRTQRKHRYATLAVQQDCEISVDALGNRAASYDDFLADLLGEGKAVGAAVGAGAGQCRFAIYDYEYEHQFKQMDKSSHKQKLILFLWCPAQASVRDKMIYSSSISSIMRFFIGIQKFIQANSPDDVSRAAVELQLRALDRD